MEEYNDTMQMLDLMVRPAFCVKDGAIIRANQAALSHMVTVGTGIADVLSTGAEEYADFSGGCLYLTLSISDHLWGASVTRMNGFDVFVLEEEAAQSELQAMALAARELRGPLASIMTVADRLFPIVEESEDPAAQEQICRINRGLFQLLRVVSNMSDASRYSKQSTANQETRDICAVLDEIFSKAAALVQQSDISLRFTGLNASILCLVDAEMLERAIYNILSNAMKFTPKGGTIDAKLTRRGKLLYLTVQDSGQGIPEQLRPCIYFRYLREPGVEDGRHGIGLGMVLIRSAAAHHGGTVLMEQPEGTGTRITMTMEIRQRQGVVRSNILKVDYAGERDHGLIELSDTLPAGLYDREALN